MRTLPARLLLTVCLLFGCSLRPSDPPPVSVQFLLPARPATAPASFAWSSVPTLIGDFDCFAINVTGPGIAEDLARNAACPSTDHVRQRGFGMISSFVRAGNPAQLFVPAGPQRRIDVYGVYPSPPECAGTVNQGSNAYYLGGVEKDLFADVSLRVPIAFNSGASATFSCSAWGAATAFSAPTSLAVSSVTDTEMTVGWQDNSPDETGYELEKCITSSCTSFSPVSGSPFAPGTTSHVVNGLSPSTIYRFRVRAVRNSDLSTWLTSSDQLSGPTPASSLTAGSVTSAALTLSWLDNAADETAYEVESCTGSGCTSFTAMSGSPFAANATSHAVTGLSASTTYRFRVRAINGTRTSAWQTTADTSTSALPLAPTALTPGTVTASQIPWTWTDNSTDETAYEVQSCTGSACTSYSAVSGSPFSAGTTSHTLTGLSASTAYRLRVRAVRGADTSSWLTSTDAITAPAAPTAFSATSLHTLYVTLGWTDNATDETAYEVESCAGASCSGFAPITGSPFAAGTLTASPSPLNGNSVYNFRVRAVRGAVPSAWTASGDVTTLPFLHYLYVANKTGNKVSGFVINPGTGALTAVPGSPYTNTGGPFRVVAHPFKPFLYALNNTGNTVSAYTITPTTGALTTVSGSPFTAGTAPYSGTIHSNGQFLYVTNDSSNNISSYTINQSTGALTTLATTTATGGTAPEGIWIHANNFLYYCGSSSNQIGGFIVNPGTGALSALGYGPFAIGGTGCNQLTGTGNVVMTANYASYDVSSFTVNTSTGALTSAMSPISAGINTNDIVATPSGSYVYASSYGDGKVYAYALNGGTGVLTALSPASYTSGTGTEGVAVDPSGTYLFSSNSGASTIRPYTITGGTGALTTGSTVSSTGTPSGMTVANVAQ